MLMAAMLFSASLADVPAAPPSVTVHTDTITHQISELSMGCHSDTGFQHQARGFYAQMIVGDSFNATGFPTGLSPDHKHHQNGAFAQAPGWNVEVSEPSVSFSAQTDPTQMFHGVPSEKLTLKSKGSAGVSNRGLGNAGMVFEGGKEYEGFFFAKVTSSDVPLVVSIEDFVTKQVLATQTLMVMDAVGDFARYNFSLTPSASTGCTDIKPGSDPTILCGGTTNQPGHTCVRCGGEFKFSLSAPGSVLVNYVYLSPGQWGRVPGLPVLLSAAETLRSMGIKVIRQGGSFASFPSAKGDMEYYQWERWTGPAWTRASRANGVWNACLLAGWGPFEMIDMCNALGIEPVITTTDTSSADELSDLVDYCHGDATTKMGQKRVADGHPEKYKVKWFELGNEQYNNNYVEQVTAMESKARELGIGKTIHYMFPSKGGVGFLNAADIAKASKLSPRIDEQMVADLHVFMSGAVEQANAIFSANPDFKMGVVNAEINAGTHSFERAMVEAADLNDWFNSASNRLHFRTTSFCMAAANDYDAWDQGISFFLPNGTWLQPPGYVHQMIDRTWQPNALQTDVPAGPWSNNLVFSAQKSDDGKTVVLRYVNFNSTVQSSPPVYPATSVTVHLKGKLGDAAFTSATMWSISSMDSRAANTPGQPSLVSPVKTTLPSFGDGTVLQIPANSYVIVEATVGDLYVIV